MAKTLQQLSDLMGQAVVLKARIIEGKSQVGAKEHTIAENEKAINRIESLREVNKSLSSQISTARKLIDDDEIQLKEIFNTLKSEGVPVSEKLQGTNIVSV